MAAVFTCPDVGVVLRDALPMAVAVAVVFAPGRRALEVVFARKNHVVGRRRYGPPSLWDAARRGGAAPCTGPPGLRPAADLYAEPAFPMHFWLEEPRGAALVLRSTRAPGRAIVLRRVPALPAAFAGPSPPRLSSPVRAGPRLRAAMRRTLVWRILALLAVVAAWLLASALLAA